MEAGATLLIPDTVYFSFDTRLARDVVVEPNVFFGTGVSVGEGSEIHSFCHFTDAKVGKNTSIGPFARLRPGAVIGDGAHIGNFVEIKASNIAPGAKINHLSYVGDSSVGSGTNVGAGTITCNYDGFMKHRTKIGRNVFIGSDTALVAPVSVGDGAVIGAGSVVTKDVPKDALVIARGEERHFKGAAKRYRAKKSAELAQKNAGHMPLPAAAARAKVAKTARPSNTKKVRRSDLKVAIPTTRAGLVGRPRASSKQRVGVAVRAPLQSKKARRSGLEGRPSGAPK
jgi:bifunctional UDP-N-acetylglucosamine pyrophosphorylase/glucosamine-1-phosphate N-acetyltransferase